MLRRTLDCIPKMHVTWESLRTCFISPWRVRNIASSPDGKRVLLGSHFLPLNGSNESLSRLFQGSFVNPSQGVGNRWSLARETRWIFWQHQLVCWTYIPSFLQELKAICTALSPPLSFIFLTTFWCQVGVKESDWGKPLSKHPWLWVGLIWLQVPFVKQWGPENVPSLSSTCLRPTKCAFLVIYLFDGTSASCRFRLPSLWKAVKT